MPEKIPIMLLGPKEMERLGRRLMPLGSVVLGLQPGLRRILPKLGFEIAPEAYCAASFISSFFYGIMLFFICFIASSRGGSADQSLMISLAAGIGKFSQRIGDVGMPVAHAHPHLHVVPALREAGSQVIGDVVGDINERRLATDGGVVATDAFQELG